MKNLMRVMVVVGVTALMIACSGGGTSSGYGKPHASPYAGVYEGKITIRATIDGYSAAESQPYRLVVANDGAVSGAYLVPTNGSCADDGKVAYPTGNVLDISATLSCTFQVVGRCSVPAHMRIVFNDAAASVQAEGKYFCETINFRQEFMGQLRKVS